MGINDEDVLALASLEQRILVTHDRKTMPTHFANFLENNTCYGVLILPL
jgi:hypothetical protein